MSPYQVAGHKYGYQAKQSGQDQAKVVEGHATPYSFFIDWELGQRSLMMAREIGTNVLHAPACCYTGATPFS